MPVPLYLRVLFYLSAFFLFLAIAAIPAYAADPVAVASIEDGMADCPGCNLADAELAFECVKGGDLAKVDLTRANFRYGCLAGAKLGGARMRFADLTGANLSDADLAGADLSNGRFRLTMFVNANLEGAKLHGADLSAASLLQARGLTQAQLDAACGSKSTKLPDGLSIQPCPAP